MKHNTMKRALAGVLAVLCVAGYLPANVGTGGLFIGTAIVASAETVDGVNFNENWSSTTSIPVPDHDSYTGLNDKSHFGTPDHAPTQHNYSMANNITLSGTCSLPLWIYGLLNTNYNKYDLRYSPLTSSMSVRMNLNNHSINANGQNILSSDYSHSDSFEYGFYGSKQSNEIISGANSLGNNYGGKWVLSGVTLTGFENIADLNSDHECPGYTTVYPAILNMKNTTASCVNGVKLTNNGQLTLDNSSITATGDYAVDLNNGSFTVSGTNNTINGKVLLNDNTITFASGAKLTGSIPIKWTGTSLNGAPRVFTSGAKNATSNNLFTGDGCYVVKDSSTGEWYAYASTFTDLSGGAIFDLEPSCYVINGQTPTLSYTVKDTKGATVDSSKFTVSYKKNGQNVTTINSEGTYTLVLTAKSGSGYTGSVTKDFYVNFLNTKGTRDFGGRTFYQLTDNSYAVTNEADWNALATYVNGGGSCSGITFKLMSDISISLRIGESAKFFDGIFDGNGYTINANLDYRGKSGTTSDDTSCYAAPFGYVSGATIQNLNVTGSIKGKFSGGIVGYHDNGNSMIKDCVVKASLESTKQGQGYSCGGIAGHVDMGSLTIEGCVFDGNITGALNNKLGSFIGKIMNGSATVNNSLTTTTQNISYCGRGGITDSNNFNLTNSATVTCGDNVFLNLGSRTDTFGNNAFVKVYNNAIQYDGKTYVQYGKTVNVTLTPPSGYSVKSVKVNNGSVSVSGSGNSRSFTMPSGTANVTAEFEKSTFTVTWVNGDGTILKTQTVNKGTTPSYGSTPTMPADEQYTYTFTRWSPAVTAVTADVTYTAQYEQTPNKYTIKFVDENGTELQSSEVAYGETPAYSGTPEKAADAQYTYTFSGWSDGTNTYAPSDALPTVVGNATYTALFSQAVNQYTITWVDGDGNTLKTDTLAYGATPVYEGETPTKTATEQYTYTFNNTWDKEITAVTGNETYTAQFSSEVNKYTVTWKNGDDVLETDENVEYGTTPTYDGETPTKEADAQYTYAFDGWTPTVDSVTGNVTYTAQFSQAVNQYTVTWVDGDGNTLKTDTLEYGATPSYEGKTPTKTATAQYTYTFNNTWDKEISDVTGNETYTAQFDSTVNQYTVILPENMEITSGTVTEGKADYGTEIKFKTKDGYLASNVKNGETVLTADADGIYTVTVESNVEVTADFETLKTTTLKGRSISLGGDIGVNFYYEISSNIAANAKAEFTVGGVTQTVDGVYDSDKGQYKFTVLVNSSQTSQEITCKIVSDDYESGEVTYSVNQYIDSIKDDTNYNSNETLMALVNAISVYGYYANEQFGTDDNFTQAQYFNDDFISIDKTIFVNNLESRGFNSYTATNGTVLSYYGSSLLLESKTTLRHYFKLNEGQSIDGVTFTVGSTTVSPKYKDGLYYVDIPNISSAELYNKQTITGSDGTTVEYYPLTYAYKVLTNANSSEKLINVVKALCEYAKCAYNYFPKQ